MNQKGLAIIVMTLIVALGVSKYVFSKYFPNKTQFSPLVQQTSIPDETADWNTYTNPKLGYSFKYPKEFKSLPKLGEHVFYSPDSKFNEITKAKTQGIEIGSTVYGPGEDIENYKGPNTIVDPSLAIKMVLPPKTTATAYVNLEDITVTIDYEKDNKKMRVMIWCGGENGNAQRCKKILIPLLSTFEFVK